MLSTGSELYTTQSAGSRMRNAYMNKDDKRLMKPVIEKRRRDRINQSLEHLRTLLLEATKDETLKNPKAEKADILKKTVQFLKLCHYPVTDNDKRKSIFKGGFQEGLDQATCFLNSNETMCAKKKEYVVERLCQHMEKQTQKFWKEPTQDATLKVNYNQVLPSPPQISRVPGNVPESPETQTVQSHYPYYPSPPSYFRTPCLGQQTPPQTVQAITIKKSTHRTLFPPSSSNPCSTLVWRPWP
ncbi:hypothetical protein GDO86_007031 [Hymenochirus boettgeri]|uniref:BHLH domain-containing protein n=1 Tax=Hymenochirus boettgeri TaxID=247094 RepID=A0A8T2J8H9_9PIPI|nr:hypothetical protein GDO86_007031 [Hymenochirus boettgeri]